MPPHRLIRRPSPWWTLGRVRFSLFVLLSACLLHLLVSMLSDPLLPLVGRDAIPGTIEGNLGGAAGAFIVHLIRLSWGVAYVVVPLVLGYLVMRCLWPKPWRTVAFDVLWALTSAVFLGATLAAALQGSASRMLSAGGLIGTLAVRLLAPAIGSVGAFLLPLAMLLILLSTRLTHGRLDAMLTSVRIFLEKSPRLPARLIRGLQSRIRALGGALEIVRLRASRGAIPISRGPAEERASSQGRDYLVAPGEPAPKRREEAALPYLAPRTVDAATPPKIAIPDSEERDAPFLSGTAQSESEQVAEDEELERIGAEIIRCLGTFKIRGELIGRTVGASVVSYQVRPATGYKFSQFEAIEKDLSLALKSEAVRVALAPRMGAIAIEIPHPRPRMVRFNDVFQSPEFQDTTLELPVALGTDITGEVVVTDLARMPHLLVAGVTGSGKSVALNVLLTSLCSARSPDELRLILIDPKRVEFSCYARLPHLRHDVICESADAHGALSWAVAEMERRYSLFQQMRVRSITEYRETCTEEESIPYLAIVVDELADLMMSESGKMIERSLVLIAQKGRAAGIHIVVATQRPDAEVVTGLLKANIAVRMAFRVSQGTNSSIILDRKGAERLMGNGDMLFLPPGAREPRRIQGAFLSTQETHEFVRWCEERHASAAASRMGEEDILQAARAELTLGSGGAGSERDELFGRALHVCLEENGASTSLLQRKLKIGYGRAARIIDQMEQSALVTRSEGTRPRELQFTYADVEEMGY